MPTDFMTASEAVHLRALVDKHGSPKAAKMLGLAHNSLAPSYFKADKIRRAFDLAAKCILMEENAVTAGNRLFVLKVDGAKAKEFEGMLSMIPSVLEFMEV